MKRSIFFLAILLIFCGSVSAESQTILNAMKDELTRSMEQLKLEGEAGPYYISYMLRDGYSLRIISDSGAITTDSENRNRSLRVDLRVGGYVLDNSNFISLSNIAGFVTSMINIVAIPIDNDYDVIRRQIWQATDRAYKNAVDNLAKKKAVLQNTLQTESVPDFAKGEATSSLAPENSLQVEGQRWTKLVDQLSKLLLKESDIQKSKVDLTVLIENSYYVNSEGAIAIEPFSATQMTIAVTTQAEDGMQINNFRTFTATRPESLPGAPALGAEIKAMIAELLALRSAPLADEYSGPILFAGQAAGQLFEQGFGSMLAARKMPVSDSVQANSMLGRALENPFQSKLSLKVAANFLSLKDLPSLKNYNQRALLGSYKVDEEGVPGQDVSLIENGILKNLLTSRAPVKGMEQSNGHARGGAAAPSVIQVLSSNRMAYDELKKKLIEAAQEEGLKVAYIVRGITPVLEAQADRDAIQSRLLPSRGLPDPGQLSLTNPCLVSRIYADGREELVRGVEFGTISANALRNVLATSDDEFIHEYQLSAASSGLSGMGILSIVASAGGGSNYATVITPSLLIGGIDLRKATGNYPKLPIVSSPIK